MEYPRQIFLHFQISLLPLGRSAVVSSYPLFLCRSFQPPKRPPKTLKIASVTPFLRVPDTLSSTSKNSLYSQKNAYFSLKAPLKIFHLLFILSTPLKAPLRNPLQRSQLLTDFLSTTLFISLRISLQSITSHGRSAGTTTSSSTHR